MGQAKLNKEQNKAIEQDLLAADMQGVSCAIMKLAKAASEHFGADCYLHAVMGKTLLDDLGGKN